MGLDGWVRALDAKKFEDSLRIQGGHTYGRTDGRTDGSNDEVVV
jgi:hypothetical protein